MLLALIAGSAAGLHAATWGMYKDSLYEGFSVVKYGRSVVLGALAAGLVQMVRPQDVGSAGGLLTLFGLAYVIERLATEWLKVFLRVEDQSKYFIPMQFAVFGRPVAHRGIRLAAGIGYAALIAGAVLLLGRLQGAGSSSWLACVGAAAFAGGLCAMGGAWKDAPCEGFQIFKFFRSPIIAAAWGAFLALFSHDLVAVAFSGLGFSIATIETWKKFSSSAAPGKFAGKPERFPEMRHVRKAFVPVYIGLWLLVMSTASLAVAERITQNGGVAFIRQLTLGGGK